MTPGASRGGSARPSGEALGVLVVVLSAVSFGTGPLLVQVIFDAGVGPGPTLFWRFLVGAVLSWAFLLVSRRRRGALRAIPPRRVLALLVLGALYVGNSGTYVAALQVVPVTLTTILTYTYPAMVAVLATRFLRRLGGRRAWLALGMSTVGVALAVGGIPADELPPPWGLALAIVSPAIYAGWIVLQARITGDRPRGHVPPADAETAPDAPDPSPASALMTTATAAVFALLLVVDGGSLSPLDVAGAAWPALIAFGAISTALAIQLFYAGIARVGGARAALISTVEPVYTIGLAALLLGETLTLVQVAGTCLVLAGVLLAESGSSRTASPTAPPVHAAAVTSPTVDGPRQRDDPAA